MANPFYFPQAFAQNPIQSFIDGKIAAQDRMKKERDRQVDLWYRYQQLQMAQAKHNAGLAKLKAETERIKQAQALAKQGAADYNGSFSRYGNSRPAALVDGAPYRPILMDPARAIEGTDPFTRTNARFSPPMRLGGPMPPDEDLSITYEGPAQAEPGVDKDGYPVPMSYEEAQKLYGLQAGDDTANVNTRRDAYFAAGGKVGGGRVPSDPFGEQAYTAPTTAPTADPFSKSKRRRYAYGNDAFDEFMLNFTGGF